MITWDFFKELASEQQIKLGEIQNLYLKLKNAGFTKDEALSLTAKILFKFFEEI